MQQQLLEFIPPTVGNGYSQGLDFVPVWLQINNPSSYYLSFPHARGVAPIPPYTLGVVIPWGQVGGNIVVDTAYTPAGAPALPVSNARVTILATTNPDMVPSSGTSTLAGTQISGGVVDVGNIAAGTVDINGPVTIEGVVGGTTPPAVINTASITAGGSSGIAVAAGGTSSSAINSGSGQVKLWYLQFTVTSTDSTATSTYGYITVTDNSGVATLVAAFSFGAAGVFPYVHAFPSPLYSAAGWSSLQFKSYSTGGVIFSFTTFVSE